MTACILGVVVWKALEAKATALARGGTDIQNLAHSLAEHAAHTIQSADIAMTGMVDLLMYQRPVAGTVQQISGRDRGRRCRRLREIGVLDTDGDWRYSSLPETPHHNNADRPYFIFTATRPGKAAAHQRAVSVAPHRAADDPALEAHQQAGRQFCRRADRRDRQRLLQQLLPDVPARTGWRHQPDAQRRRRSDSLADIGQELRTFPKPTCSPEHLKLSSVGYYKIISPFDGIVKYFGYEETSQFPLVVTVAMSEDWLLAGWLVALRTDALVAGVLLCMIILLAALLSSQFSFRTETERALREREAHYRLLANNIADVIILIDARGILRFVSQSVEPVLGLRAPELIGTSCLDLVHPEDKESVMAASARL